MTPGRAVLLLIASATAVRLLLAATTDLGLDEAYALVMGRQWQLSYFDHPPLVFWMAGAMQAIGGPDIAPFWLRLPFIALSAATAWLLHRLAARHFGEPAGLWTVLLLVAAPFFLLSAGSWVVPDGPLCFFLAVAALALSGIVRDGERGWSPWLLAGVALGLALLSKYHAVLFALGVLGYFALTPGLRHWFLRPHPYIAVLLALAVFAPVLVWNASNDWASFGFQLGRRVAPDAAFMLRQSLFEIVYLLPTTAVLLVVAVFRGLGRRDAWFFLALGLPAIVVLDGSRFLGSTGFPHWAMPGWLLLLPLAGAIAASWRWRHALAAATLVQAGIVIAAVLLLLSVWRIDMDGLDEFRLEAAAWRELPATLAAAGRVDEAVVAANWRDGTRMAEMLAGVPLAVMDTDPRGFAWREAPPPGSTVLIVTRTPETAAALARYETLFERFEPLGSFPVQASNAARVDVTRAIASR